MLLIFVCGWCKSRTEIETMEEMNKLYCSENCEKMVNKCGRCYKKKPINNVVHGVRLCSNCYRKIL